MTDENINNDHYFLEDCLNAITNPILSITAVIREELQQLYNTCDRVDPNQMGMIWEEQSECDPKDVNYLDKYQQLRAQFNFKVRILTKAEKRLDELTCKYKKQLQSFATDIFDCNQEIKKLKEENQLLKHQIKSRHPKKQRQKQEELYVRRPPSPIGESHLIAKQKIVHQQQQRNNWKALSGKIQECKKKIAIYEHQLKEKDDEISKLKALLIEKQKQNKHQKYDQQIKKLKKDNTHLRGEKVCLNSQLVSTKKQMSDTIQINQIQESEIKKLRMEIDNLSSSLNWHASNLSELRNSCKKITNKETQMTHSTIDNLTRINAIMGNTLSHQQQLLEQINEKCKKIEEGWSKEGQKYQKKIIDLENILEDKNETIIKLKSSSKGEKNNYYADMVKVLNKKLAEKEDKIRFLEENRYNHSPRQT